MWNRFCSMFRFLFPMGLFATCVIIPTYTCSAEDFDWRTAGGGNFVSSVKNQFIGTCWAHGNTACLEVKYKLTRNDPNFEMDLSEENLIYENDPAHGYPDMGSTNGGGPYVNSFNYFSSHGLVSETELPGWTDGTLTAAYGDPASESGHRCCP